MCKNLIFPIHLFKGTAIVLDRIVRSTVLTHVKNAYGIQISVDCWKYPVPNFEKKDNMNNEAWNTKRAALVNG